MDQSNNMLMDKDRLLQIFDYLNERLKSNQLQMEITIYRGTVMTIVYDNRPATKDIDCVFSEVNQKLLENILEMTRFTFNLPENWINEEIKEPLKSIIKEDKETYKVYSNLKILRPKAEQLLATRAEPAKDFIDAFILCRDLDIKTREELLNVVERYLPLTLIGER